MSRRLEFEERAAVLEFDGGLARAGAEQRALADIYHELLDCRGRAHGILDELIRVDARRQAPELHEALQALGLAGVRAPLFAYQHCSSSTTGCAITGGAFYNPSTVKFTSTYDGR